jgi:hypothetical protein
VVRDHDVSLKVKHRKQQNQAPGIEFIGKFLPLDRVPVRKHDDCSLFRSIRIDLIQYNAD